MMAKEVTFEGRVQGVGFRHTVLELARGFDVTGWVRNEPDGSVLLLAAGEADEVNGFLREILEESPVAGHIQRHVSRSVPRPAGLKGFRIER